MQCAPARFRHPGGARHRLSGRYFFDELDNPALIDRSNRLTALPDRRWQSQSANLSHTFTVGPSLLNNTTLSYNRASNVQIGPDFAGNRAVGMNVPILSKGDTLRFSVSGYFGSSYNALYRVPRNQYNIQHGWTWIFGRHELDFGLDLLREQSILDQDFLSDGSTTFAGRFSGDNLVDFLCGRPIAPTQTFPMPFLVVAYDPEFKYPTIHQWNVTIEQSVFARMIARITCQGSTGRNMFHAADKNAAVFGPGADRTNTDQRRPRREFTQLTFAGTYGRTNYNALIMSIERRLTRGLTFLAGYSWQKSLDVTSSTAFEGNASAHPYGSHERDYGVSDYHRAGRFTGLFTYELPLAGGTAPLRLLFGGWQLNGVMTMQTGGPLNIVTG